MIVYVTQNLCDCKALVFFHGALLMYAMTNRRSSFDQDPDHEASDENDFSYFF